MSYQGLDSERFRFVAVADGEVHPLTMATLAARYVASRALHVRPWKTL